MLNNILTNNKLIVTVLKKGAARKMVKASKESGAEGGTIILAQGGSFRERSSFLGVTSLPEREVILTIIGKERWEDVWETVCKLCTLDKKKKGLAFTIDLRAVTGVCHLCDLSETIDETEDKEEVGMIAGSANSINTTKYKLIITIVNKGDSEIVLNASKDGGARGGTILFGRGTGVHEHAKLFGISIEPEKELVLTLIEKEKAAKVLENIIKDTKLDKPGHGIAFIIDVDSVAGIAELEELKKRMEQK